MDNLNTMKDGKKCATFTFTYHESYPIMSENEYREHQNEYRPISFALSERLGDDGVAYTFVEKLFTYATVLCNQKYNQNIRVVPSKNLITYSDKYGRLRIRLKDEGEQV